MGLALTDQTQFVNDLLNSCRYLLMLKSVRLSLDTHNKSPCRRGGWTSKVNFLRFYTNYTLYSLFFFCVEVTKVLWSKLHFRWYNLKITVTFSALVLLTLKNHKQTLEKPQRNKTTLCVIGGAKKVLLPPFLHFVTLRNPLYSSRWHQSGYTNTAIECSDIQSLGVVRNPHAFPTEKEKSMCPCRPYTKNVFEMSVQKVLETGFPDWQRETHYWHCYQEKKCLLKSIGHYLCLGLGSRKCSKIVKFHVGPPLGQAYHRLGWY